MSTINVNGIDLELDLLDADVMEKYSAAVYKSKKEIEKTGETDGDEESVLLSLADNMRKQCRIVEEAFADVFGEETTKKCFPRKNHHGDHLEAYALFCSMMKDAEQKVRNIDQKYTGQRLNRQQRRAQNKGKQNKGNYNK